MALMLRLLAAGVLVPFIAVIGTAVAAIGSGTLDPQTAGSVICQPITAPAGPAPAGPAAAGPSGAPGAGGPATAGPGSYAGTWLDAGQVANARTIRDVGVALGMPDKGVVVALATAMTESGLHNLTYGDADSLGLFQQRPSTGWGTPAQILDPVYAATRFYQALAEVPGWQNLPVTVAAQQVQRSAFPNRYATWEALAVALTASMSGSATACAALEADTPLPGDVAGALPPGFTLPAGTPIAVVTAITWALRQLGTSYHYGGDCTDPHSGVPAHQCDCSSLTQQAYRAAGITLTRTTYTQVHEGVAVPDPAHLRPGDLIFLPGHVGIYLGAGLVLHAPHTGDVVRVSTIPYWIKNFVAARRIVN
jgi:cell wall-associated NlpC family hydrolase